MHRRPREPMTGRRTPMAFETRAVAPGISGLAVAGEVDIATAEELERALDAAIRAGSGRFVVDLSELAFLDVTGLHVLLGALALLRRLHRDLVLICPPGPVRRMIDLNELTDGLAVVSSRSELGRSLPSRSRGAAAG
jgi:anti-anti-sigma factor